VKNNKREGKKVCRASSINNYPPVKVFYTGEAYTKLPIELYESASLAVHALATLGDATQIGLVLFLLYCTR
jgi:hypothetical protein